MNAKIIIKRASQSIRINEVGLGLAMFQCSCCLLTPRWKLWLCFISILSTPPPPFPYIVGSEAARSPIGTVAKVDGEICRAYGSKRMTRRERPSPDGAAGGPATDRPAGERSVYRKGAGNRKTVHSRDGGGGLSGQMNRNLVVSGNVYCGVIAFKWPLYLSFPLSSPLPLSPSFPFPPPPSLPLFLPLSLLPLSLPLFLPPPSLPSLTPSSLVYLLPPSPSPRARTLVN